jgi:transketolase
VRKQLVKTVTDILEKDPRVVLLLGDIGVYGFREAFAKFPDRVYNIGILEQASVGLAAGLAIEGFIPIFHSITPFIVERDFEALKLDFGYQKLGGNFISVGGSYDYSSLGCSHHCPGDVQILKTIPDVQIFVPGHPEEFDTHFRMNYANGKLNYFRLSEQSNLYPCLDRWVRVGEQGAVIAIGPMLDRTLEACNGLDVDIFYSDQVEPFSSALKMMGPSRLVVVEPFYEGTMSYDIQKVCEDMDVLHIGVPRQFLTSYGTRQEHDEKYGLTSVAIRERIKRFLNL